MQFKICRFHDFLSQKGSRPPAYSISHSAAPIHKSASRGGPAPRPPLLPLYTPLGFTFAQLDFTFWKFDKISTDL